MDLTISIRGAGVDERIEVPMPGATTDGDAASVSAGSKGPAAPLRRLEAILTSPGPLVVEVTGDRETTLAAETVTREGLVALVRSGTLRSGIRYEIPAVVPAAAPPGPAHTYGRSWESQPGYESGRAGGGGDWGRDPWSDSDRL
jgi:hypothetical protein